MTENTPVIITSAETFTAIRTGLNLSRKDLADLTGLTQAVIWRIEHVPAGAEKDADTDIRTRMQTTLTSYVVEHPGGKPKAAKKTPTAAKPTTGIDQTELVTAFHAIIEVVDAWRTDAKAKKSSVKSFDAITTELHEQLHQLLLGK